MKAKVRPYVWWKLEQYGMKCFNAVWRPTTRKSKLFVRMANVTDNRLLVSVAPLQKWVFFLSCPSAFPWLYPAQGKWHALSPRFSRQEECVTKCVHASCLIAEEGLLTIRHHHRKWPTACFEVPPEFFIIPSTISGEPRQQTPPPPTSLPTTSSCSLLMLHDSASPRTAATKTPVRMQNKHLLA